MAMTEEELTAANEKYEADKAQFEADKTARFKDDPAYTNMSKQIADMRKVDDDRKAADEAAKVTAKEEADAAAIKKAEDEKDFVTAQKLRDDAHAAEIAKMKADTDKANLRSELAVVGFEKRGVDLLTSEYDAETHGTIEEYSKKVSEDEANKGFLGADGRTVHTAPGKLPAGGGGENWEQVKLDIDSPDRKTRIAARAKVTAHREKTGEYPF